MNLISAAPALLWLSLYLQVVDLYETYEWRTSFTTRKKELSTREMNVINGT